MKRWLIAAVLIAPLAASAQTPYLGPDGTPARPFNVIGSLAGGGAYAQMQFSSGSITTANTYQQLAAAGSCTHGGLITATQSASSTGVEYVDITGATAGGTALRNGAIPLGGSQATNQPGQSYMIPPTTNAVMIYGPAGATFGGYCS